jgi:uncharacterized Zn finger protein
MKNVKKHLSNAKSLNADIEQYPEYYADLSERKTKLIFETENKEIYTDAFVFSKKKKIMLFLMLKTVSRSISHERYIKEQKKMKRQE